MGLVGVGQLVQQVGELFILVIVVFKNVDRLFDILVYGKAAIVSSSPADFDVNRCHRTKLACNYLNLSRPGGTEHDSLSIRVLDVAHDFLNIFFKPHIQHSIGLIET